MNLNSIFKISLMVLLLSLLCVPFASADLAKTWCKGLAYGNACFNGTTGENILTGVKVLWADILDVNITGLNLTNYYTKDEVYNKTEVDNLLLNVSGSPGPQGPPGVNGTNGIDGTNGTNGVNGVNGTTFYTGGKYLYDNGSNVIYFNESQLANANVNGSNYWDNLDTPLDIRALQGVTISTFIPGPGSNISWNFGRTAIFFNDSGNNLIHELGGEAFFNDQMRNNILLSRINVSYFSNSSGIYAYIYEIYGQKIIININTHPIRLGQNNYTVKLTQGTNSTPTVNWIYWENENNPTLTVSTNQPTGNYALAAKAIIGDDSNLYAAANMYDINYNFLSGVSQRFRIMGLLYSTGFDITGTVSNINFTTGSYFYQTDLRSTSTPVSINTGFFYINSSNNYLQTNDISTFTKYNDGTTIGNKIYYNVVYGIVLNQDGIVKMMALMQGYPGLGNEYNTVDAALADTYEVTQILPSQVDIKYGFLPIARVVMKREGGINTIALLPSGKYYKDLRGTIGMSSGGGTGITAHSDLTNLQWSVAGHTFDTNLNLNGNNVTGNVANMTQVCILNDCRTVWPSSVNTTIVNNITNNITTVNNITNNITTTITSGINGTGTNGTLAIWLNGTVLGNSNIKEEVTDESFMTFYNGNLYVDSTNGAVGVNVVPGSESHTQALEVEVFQYQGALTLNSSTYDPELNITLVNANGTLPEWFTDAAGIHLNGGNEGIFVWARNNDTSFYIRGNTTLNTKNYTWHQAPYVDVNGHENSERGYTISENGAWKWAMMVPDQATNSSQFCIQNADLFYKGTNAVMCLDTANGVSTLHASGAGVFGDNVYVGYGASATNSFNDIYLPNKYVGIDATENDSSGFVLGYQGQPEWDMSIYSGEKAQYLYLGYNYKSGETSFTLSENGRIGVNKQDNILEYHTGFNGTGLNDGESSGTYSGQYPDNFEVQAVNATAFKWRININGRGWGAYSSPINMNGSEQLLYKGVYFKFASPTGHTTGDTWYFTAFSQQPSSVFSISPQSYYEVLSYNGSYTDDTFEAGTTGGIAFGNFGKTNSYIYVGKPVEFGTTYFNLATAGSNLTIKVEFYNGTDWQTMDTTNALYYDTTANLTKTGSISWDKSSITWSKDVAVEDYPAGEYYWVRYSTTSPAIIAPKFYSITPQGVNRLEVYQSPYDISPTFSVAPNGDTVISGTLLANGFYGELYNGTAATLTLLTQNAWVNVTGYFTGELSGWTSTGGYKLVCTQSGLYSVYYSINAALSANEAAQYQVMVNDVVETKGDITYRYSTGLASQVTGNFFRRFNAGDVMYIQARDIGSNNKVLTVDNKNIMVTRIGN